MLLTREELEKQEAGRLASYAVKSAESQGREFKEGQDPHRLAFQLDRDRIIHSKAFRRLKAKTQVFVAHHGDHYRTRLTHSLEVGQISRGVARTLGLNEDLAEAIALAHDLGHTPFGHAGEEALDECLQAYGLRFEHNAQSRRTVEELERVYPDFAGLNLSFETRMGLIKHQTPWDKPAEKDPMHPSLEAQVVNLADEIAYLNHDLDDGLGSEILKWEQVAELALFKKGLEAAGKKYGAGLKESLRRPRVISQLINLMILDVYEASEKLLVENKIESLEDVYGSDKQLIVFSPGVKKEIQEINEFLLKNLYFHPQVRKKSEFGQQIVQDLFYAYHQDSGRLPEATRRLIEAGVAKERVIQDYIAGMSDQFAEREWEKRQ